MPETNRVRLVDFRISYGECVGYCRTILTIDDTALELVQRSDDEAGPDLRYLGSAERPFAERVRDLAAVLEPARLAAVYGTPDAHDEGAAIIRLGVSAALALTSPWARTRIRLRLGCALSRS